MLFESIQIITIIMYIIFETDKVYIAIPIHAPPTSHTQSAFLKCMMPQQINKITKHRPSPTFPGQGWGFKESFTSGLNIPTNDPTQPVISYYLQNAKKGLIDFMDTDWHGQTPNTSQPQPRVLRLWSQSTEHWPKRLGSYPLSQGK